MAKFIRLTECLGNDETKSILLNVAYIMHVQLGMKGKDVHVRMNDKSFYFVKESFEEVSRMVNPEPELAASTVANRSVTVARGAA